MTGRNRWLTFSLAAALLTAVLTGWSPLYWSQAAAICALCLAGLAYALFGERPRFSLDFIAACLIGGWGFLQLMAGLTQVPAMTFRASLVWGACPLAFLLGSSLLADRREREWFLRVMTWALTILAIEAILQFFISPTRVLGLFDGEESVTGTMFYRNQFAAVMEIGAGFALWQVRAGRPVIGALCYASMFGAAVATESRAGSVLILAELIVFLIFASIRSRRQSGSRAPALVLLVFAILSSAVVGTEGLWDRFQEKNMFAIRTELRASTVKMIGRAPLKGTGIGTWRAVYPAFATLDAIVIANEAHNDWLQWVADGGIPFLLLMLFLVLRTGASGATHIWGLGLLTVMAHCLVDYEFRAPALSFLWFTIAGAASVRKDIRE